MNDQAVARARALVGCRFRPQGRVAKLGLDCIGLACAAYGIPAERVPRDYRLRGNSRDRIEREISGLFKSVPAPRPGDLLLLSVSSDQLHLAVKTEIGFVHADAGLGKVMEVPGSPPWPLLSAYRLRQKD